MLTNYGSVLKLLTKYGTYIYTGNKKDDIELIAEEIKELYESGILFKEDYLKAILILRQEASRIK